MWRPLLLALLSFACSDDSSEETPADESLGGEVPAVEAEPSFADQVVETARREREAAMVEVRRKHEEAMAQAREDAVAVQRARAAGRAGEWDRAYALLQPLIARAPNGRRLHCEAGYYAFKAGDHRAASLLDRGLHLHGPPEDVSETMRVPLAMCLYNRGRVFEDADERERAAALYRASLELRPNATVASRLRELGEVRVVEFRVTPERTQYPGRETGPNLQAMLEQMAPAVCVASPRRYDREEVLACQIDRRRLRPDGEGPRVDFVVFRPSERDAEPTLTGDYDEVGYLAIHAHEGTQAIVFGPVSYPSVMDYDPRADPPRVISWIDLDGDGRAELLAEIHDHEASSEDGCSDSSYTRTMFVARRTGDRWDERFLSVGTSYTEMCLDRAYTEDGEEIEEMGEVESEERVTGLPAADFDVPDGGGLRFRHAGVERRFSVAELFERCDRGCSLAEAAGQE